MARSRGCYDLSQSGTYAIPHERDRCVLLGRWLRGRDESVVIMSARSARFSGYPTARYRQLWRGQSASRSCGCTPFDVSEDRVAIELVSVRFGVREPGVRQVILALPDELDTAPRALLLVLHAGSLRSPVNWLSGDLLRAFRCSMERVAALAIFGNVDLSASEPLVQ